MLTKCVHIFAIQVNLEHVAKKALQDPEVRVVSTVVPDELVPRAHLDYQEDMVKTVVQEIQVQQVS